MVQNPPDSPEKASVFKLTFLKDGVSCVYRKIGPKLKNLADGKILFPSKTQ